MDDARRYLPLTPQQFHILLALTDGDLHGYGIILEIAERTGGALRLGTGTLYTAVARMLALGFLCDVPRHAVRADKDKDKDKEKDKDDERRRYYRLTPLGRAVLKAETARLDALLRHARAKGIQPAWPPVIAR
jgi:DNA-binding PadR family transcriptional regulator